MPFEEVDHTADRALRVWAADARSLFLDAAHGMINLMGDPPPGCTPTGWQDIELEAIDQESLLVEWLNELLYLAEETGGLFVTFDVLALTEYHLRARAGWVPARASKAHIKAATYHNLAIVQTADGVSVELTFDV